MRTSTRGLTCKGIQAFPAGPARTGGIEPDGWSTGTEAGTGTKAGTGTSVVGHALGGAG